jgi:predicted nucleotidyltransferase
MSRGGAKIEGMNGAPQIDPGLVAAAIEVATAEPRIVGLYLFGSQANGDVHEKSDVDLGALFAEKASLADVVRLEARFEERLRRRVDLVDVGSCEPFLALAIIRGERIHCTDSTRCDEFDLYVLRRAGDLAPFEKERRRMMIDEPFASRVGR